jgi:hypothetical protein
VHVTTQQESARRERSLLEAGLFGFAVIYALAGATMLAGSLIASVLEGDFELGEFEMAGLLILVMSGGFWILSRLARR